MDPDEALLKLREAVNLYVRRYRDKGTGLEEANAVTDAFEVLDDWLSNGGFPPDDWHWQREQEAHGEGT